MTCGVASRPAEAELAAERHRTGRRVLGRRGVLEQSTPEPRRNLRPRVAARSKWTRLEALLRNRAFLAAYATARAAWRDGMATAFPVGTYWLHRFANVPLAAT